MRAGCFAETRVIRLLNRRFVNHYYNTGPVGLGQDDAAAEFTKGKTKNVYAFYSAFNGAGEPLGVTDIYASKDTTFDFLVALLRENPEYDRYTAAEQAVVDSAAQEPTNAAAQLAAGELFEDLGRYQEAEACYQRVTALAATTEQQATACRGLLRVNRYQRRWERLESLCKEITGRQDVEKLDLAADVAMESGFALLAQKQYEQARTLLEGAIARQPRTPRISELRFNAGVACFFLKDVDTAYYHWCWVVENLPDDRLTRRSFIAAAHQGMPYKNPELDGYEAPLSGGNIQVINNAYEQAKKKYLQKSMASP